MCGVDHNLFPRPGYLIDVACESIAAKVLFTRMLNNRAVIGLTPDQIVGLIDLNAQYQQELVALRTEFARITEQLEHKRGRIDQEALVGRKALLDRHVELFRAEEETFFAYAARGHALLTDEQIAAIDRLYHAEKDAALGELATALNNAVSPTYQFVPAQP